MFKKLIGLLHMLEKGNIDETVVYSIDLTIFRWASRICNIDASTTLKL